MKHSNINVEFKKPENELKEQLQRSGARNIDIRRSFNGALEVRYSIILMMSYIIIMRIVVSSV